MRFTRFVLRVFPFLPYTAEVLEPILRKCAHFGIFMVEGMLLCSALMTTLRRPAVGGACAVLICGLVAVLNEYHESFSVGRSCELRDMLIDTSGGFTGALIASFMLWLIFRAVQRRSSR